MSLQQTLLQRFGFYPRSVFCTQNFLFSCLKCLQKKESLTLLRALLNNEAGFVVSAELVLIATILVIGLIVGLNEVQHAVVSELNDVGDAIGNVDQSYYYSGFSAYKNGSDTVKSYTRGSSWRDTTDDCDNSQCDIACDEPVVEGPKH